MNGEKSIETHSNYFADIEEHFRSARGTLLFRLSSNDWVLIDKWKKAGIPLEAVLRGIDTAFEKWRKRRERAGHEMVNSLAYCEQAVMAEAQALANRTPSTSGGAPLKPDDIREYLVLNAEKLRKAGHVDLAISLEALDLGELFGDLQQMEQRLTVIEETMITRLLSAASREAISEARCSFDAELKPFRNRMSADQLVMLEKQFLERKLLQAAGLPRLSLFHLGA